jgi:hypothetical protein
MIFLSPVHAGSVARRELLKSKLPSAELGKIWRLADTDRKVPCHQLLDSAAMVCSSVYRYVHNIYPADHYLASKKRVPALSKEISWKGEGVDGFRGNDLQLCLQTCI